MTSDKLADLERRLEGEPLPSRARVDALNDLARELGFRDIHRTAELASEASRLARELDHPNSASSPKSRPITPS